MFGPFILSVLGFFFKVYWAFSLKCIGPFLRKSQEKNENEWKTGKVKQKIREKEIRREFGDGVPVADSLASR